MVVIINQSLLLTLQSGSSHFIHVSSIKLYIFIEFDSFRSYGVLGLKALFIDLNTNIMTKTENFLRFSATVTKSYSGLRVVINKSRKKA